MNEEKKRILDLLAEGKLSSEEAMMLMDQLQQDAPPAVYRPDAVQRNSSDAKMLRVRIFVLENGHDKPTNVNVNLPLKAARIAGNLITSMMPEAARDSLADQGINLQELNFGELLDSLEEAGGDIVNITQEDDDQQVTVRVYVE